MKLRNWDDVDEAGRRLGEIERECAVIKAKADEKISDAKAERDKVVKPMEKEAEAIQDQIAAFYWDHPQDRDEGAPKRKTLTHVVLKERLSRTIKWPRPLSGLIDKIKEHKLKKYLRVKEEVDKKAINAEANKTDLAKLGLSIEETSIVYVEPLDA